MGVFQIFARIFTYLAAAISLLSTAHSAAQPHLRVQAPSEMKLRWTQGPTLKIELSDDRGQPLPFQTLSIQWPVGGRHAGRAVTDSAGQVKVPLREGVLQGQIRVDFPGDGYHLPVSDTTDLSALTAPQELRWRAPRSSVDLSVPNQRFIAQLEASSTATDLSERTGTIALLGQDPLAKVASDDRGRLEFSVPSSELPAGAFELEVHVRARDLQPAVHLRKALHAHLPTALKADVTRGAGAEVKVSGELTTPRGPVPTRGVALRSGERTIAETTTDEHGRFLFSLAAEAWDAAAGPAIQVYFESTESSLRSATSKPLNLSPQPQPTKHVWWPWALSCLCLSGLALAKWRGRRESALPDATIEPSELVVTPGDATPRTENGHPRVRGSVSDAASGRPIAAASVQLFRGEIPWTTLETTTAGGFACAAPPPGSYRLVVHADSYLPQERMLTLATQGAAIHLNIALTSTRLLVWQAFKPIASRVPSDAIQGPIATPAEVFRWGQHVCHMPLQNLSTAAEQTLFGRGAPSPENASRLQRALQQVAVKASDPEQEQT